MTDQLQLIPGSPPEQKLEKVELERLAGFEHAQPSRELREQIAQLGLLQPILAVPAREGRYRIVDGRRRAKAIEQLAEQNRWCSPPSADVLILETADTHRRAVRAGLTLALHASRGPSPASELAAIEAILDTANGNDQAATVKEIAAQTGMSVQTVRRRLRLRTLSPGLRRAFDEGEITATVAEAAARLSADQQQALVQTLLAGERLTLAAIRTLARGRAHEATEELPDALFADHTTAWQTTVVGHLKAALAALPADARDTAVARAVTEAIVCSERG